MTTQPGDQAGPLDQDDPRELGPYRLLTRLGRGGMGTVYLGEEQGGRRVAVKVINRELAGMGPFRERFRREVTAARQVRRFCTAPVLDAQLDSDPLYVVTEYIEGPSLERAVAERGPLPGSDLEGLAVGVATALAAIHGAGIVHRDLKPANVLLSATGPRVIDFGIARAFDAQDGPTRTGQFVGTPSYLPPELLLGEPITAASDVFSWGCVVAFAGTGHAPFAGRTVPETFFRVAHDPPNIDGLDDALRHLVERALDKNARNRPTTQELLARLVGQDYTDPARAAETVQATWHGAAPGGVGGVEQTRRDLAGTPLPPPPPPLPPPQTAGMGYPPAGGGLPPPPPGPYQTSLTNLHGPDRRGRRRGGKLALLIAAPVAVLVIVAVAAAAFLVRRGEPVPGDTKQVFADDFSNSSSGWYGDTYSSGEGYEAGHYRVDADNDEDWRVNSAPAKATPPKRTLISATANIVSGPPYGQFGLWCRGTQKSDAEAGYWFLVRRDGKSVVLRKVSPGAGSKQIGKKDEAKGYKRGKPNRIQIACEEQSGGAVKLRIWLNGTLALSASDGASPLKNDTAGVITARENQQGDQVTTDFDDFEIAEIRG